MSRSIYDISQDEIQESKGKRMIREHKKRTKGQKLSAFKVPNDPCNTVFFCKDEQRGQHAVSTHIRQHKDFWK